MIAEIFAYAMLVALLVGLGAASVERFLAEVGLPRRFAWVGAYAVVLAFPAIALCLAAAKPPPTAVGSGIGYVLVPAAYVNVDWDTALVIAWATSTALMLAVYLAAWLRLTVMAKRWPRAESGFGPVTVSADVGPAVLGVLGPRIVLPRWLIEAPAPTRSVVIAHEREHIAARDPVLIVASQLVTILLPWNLPLWWFARRLRAAIEIDCDARVLRTGADAAHYGDVLLAVGQRGAASPRMAAALIEPVTQLERRIRIMLTKPRPRSRTRVVTALLVSLGVAACATQVDPPALPTSSESAATQVRSGEMEITASHIEFRSGQPPASAEDLTVKITAIDDARLHTDSGSVRMTSDRASQTTDGILFEGNVRLELGGMSITTDRAVVTQGPDGRTILALADAKVTRRE